MLPHTPAAFRAVALHTKRGTPSILPSPLPHTTMPGDKPTGKPAHQILEALAQQRPVPVMMVPPMTDPPETVKSPKSDISMEHILKITEVGRRLEGMDTKISVLAAESKSIRNDIASFQDTVMNIDHRLFIVEDKLNSSPHNVHELH
ncbi:hypothetical protein NDU88_002836 [Pleurodeles waltl]|uniref:Uncharacterized protein n=1 Tax=Pleurodeles waltl TaxID=8319 RepID=A0AAV7KT82_PLEWA|nr:hypothetical protein NDU88_002836 [Pleurodeles waltl]